MRRFVILLGVISASLSGFIASADTSRVFPFKKAETSAEQPVRRSHCARKIALGPDKSEVGCLMQKHKGRDR